MIETCRSVFVLNILITDTELVVWKKVLYLEQIKDSEYSTLLKSQPEDGFTDSF
jgi:hypothetical protein